LDERLGFGELITQHLSGSRRGKNTQLPLADLLRQSVYSRIAGYEDVNDAEQLSQDPTFRLIGYEKIWERKAALTSRLQSFETEMPWRSQRRRPERKRTAEEQKPAAGCILITNWDLRSKFPLRRVLPVSSNWG